MHREGSLAFKNLFKGDEGDPNNFRWVLSRNSGNREPSMRKGGYEFPDQPPFHARNALANGADPR